MRTRNKLVFDIDGAKAKAPFFIS